jgi:hypothetical protein
MRNFGFATIDIFSKLLRIIDPETPEESGQGDDTGFNFCHAELVSASFIRQFTPPDNFFSTGLREIK